MARWQEAAHSLIYLARLGGIESWKFDFVNLKIPEQDAAIVHVHIRLRLHLDDADDLFPPFRRQRKSHAKGELLKVCPRIDLRLVVHQASLFVRALPRPARICRGL